MFWYELKLNSDQAIPASFKFRSQTIPLDPVKFKNFVTNQIRVFFEENESTPLTNKQMDDYLVAMINADALTNRRDLVLIIQNLCVKRAKNVDWPQIIKEISR